ncbi:sugar ABC transporter substrate-binding protein [Hydrococcus rivularis NIES-593]|uniref:Sugar ABC transporter substrate-binding protein n=1 Tax=Hydrococcus rivularis NIES-593 TaxID=1921803 RepID=A0A1U7HRK9_9CYAN|nr:SLBB domain-containing protein [Hydrococcus rivularis]OKH26222.1 sugar ABC transporter substrate-binding protein [Hydrococcus rivularis NIES-593]
MMFDPISRQVFSIRSRRASALTAAFVVLSSLSVPAYAQQPQATTNVQSPSASNLSPAETEYTLGAGDRIRVDIFQVEELSGEFLVLVDGTVSFPLVGNLKVEGLTTQQLSSVLSQNYAPFLKRPVVTVSLLAPRPLKIAVAGEVNSPGSYTLPLGETGKFPSVTDLIRQAGGVTASADVGQVQIRRFFQGKQQVLTLNMWELLQEGNQGQNITLRDGDTVIIPTKAESDPTEIRQLADANFGIQADRELNVAVVGEVARPGSYKLTPQQGRTGENNTSINNVKLEPPRLSNAIQLAGGIKPLADVRHIEVRRQTRSGTQQIIAVDLWDLLQSGNIDRDVILQDGDTIVIPTAEALNPEESESLAAASFSPATIRVNVVGEVKQPGVVEVPPNTPLNQALLAAGGFNEQRAETDKVELVRLNPNGTVTKREIELDFSSGIDDEKNPALRNNDVVVVNRSGLASATDTLGTVLSPIGSIFGFFNFFRIFN